MDIRPAEISEILKQQIASFDREQAAEAVLTGKTIDEPTARAAAKAAMASATPLSGNGFKTQLFQTAIYRTILLAAGQMQRDPSAIG